MAVCSIHTAANGSRQPDVVISDRFSWLRLAALPVWFVVHGFWMRLAVWTVAGISVIVAMGAGLVSAWAALGALLLLQLMLACEAPEAMRKRLAREGRPIDALVEDSSRVTDALIANMPDDARQPPARTAPGAPLEKREILGLFPEKGSR